MAATPSKPATCPGSWRFPREIGEGDPYISVQRCDGCDDLLVIFRGRSYDVAPGADDRTIIRTVLQAVLEAV